MKEIQLTQGKVALVDDEDFEYLSQWKWHIEKVRNNIYAKRTSSRNEDGKQSTIRMHRFIMNAKKYEIVDHENRNGLDNQKHNLRFCTRNQNAYNRKAFKGSTSRYKGVWQSKGRNKWVSRIWINGKQKYLGTFEDENQAAKAYNIVALQIHRDFAVPNIITT